MRQKIFKSAHIYMKDADFTIYAIFSFWDMVVFVLIIGKFSMNFQYKIDHNLQTVKIGNFIFYWFQHITHISWKFYHFWERKFRKFYFIIEYKIGHIVGIELQIVHSTNLLCQCVLVMSKEITNFWKGLETNVYHNFIVI